MKKEKEKQKNIVFSEAIDSALNGYALGISFIGIGCFLLLQPDYFFAPIISYIVGSIIGALGVMGTGVELSKSSKIKGMDSLTMGVVALGIWLVVYMRVHAVWANILVFILFVLGCYGVILGLLQAAYSIIANTKAETAKKDENGKASFGKIISQAVLFLTQLCSLVIAFLNVMKALSV